MKPRGFVTLVGAGPGDPDLITVRGITALARADVIVYDYLVNTQILNNAPEHAQRIYAGKMAEKHKYSQEEINRLLADLARAGKRVVRLKGGDPYIFGRGSEETSYLASQGIPFRVIPGVPAALGAAAYAGIPLTDRRFNSSVTFITGHEQEGKKKSLLNWKALAQSGSVLVFYMGVRNLPKIIERLRANGMADQTPAACVEWATLPRQRLITGTLASISAQVLEHKIEPPALTIVGSTVDLHETLHWFGRLPLRGRTILVTRQSREAEKMCLALRQDGAEAISAPAIRIESPMTWRPVDEQISRLSRYDWVIFTSVNGVAYFLNRIKKGRLDSRCFNGIKIAAIGPVTAAKLDEYGLRADFVPKRFTSSALAAELDRKYSLKDRAVLLPRADIAQKDLTESLCAAGAQVTNVSVYKTLPCALDKKFIQSVFQTRKWIGVIFTSSSTVAFFLAALKKACLRMDDRVRCFSIGPQTSQTLCEYGITPAAEAREHTIDGLIAVIRKYCEENELE